DPNKPTLLLNLGSSAIGDLQPLADILQRFPDWQILSTKDELGRTKGFDEYRVIQLTGIFPLHPYLRAVDLAITSVGYNAAHEFVAMNVPAIYVAAPNVTDDQKARANAIAKLKAGWSVSPDAPEELAALLNQILTGGASTLAAVQANCEIATAGFGDGAAAAASAILKSSAAAKPSFMMQSRLQLRLRFERLLGNLVRREKSLRYREINLTRDISAELIRNEIPFEHVLPTGSNAYLSARNALSQKWLLG
ncbi:MAG: hypothetical protein RL038_676, partial [Actinomycetota bacterium]